MQQWGASSQAFPILFHSISKLLRANTRSIETNLGGGAIGHLSIIMSIAACATVAPTHQWVNPESPGRGPTKIDGGTAAQIAAERHRWGEAVVTFRTWTNVDQALKNQMIMIFEPM
jgi:hypothetical protein